MSSVVLTLQSGDDLTVRHFSVLGAMSSCFQIDLTVRGREDLDLEAITGHPAGFTIQGTGGAHTWTGVCASVAQTQIEADGHATYALRVAPVLWLLTHRVNHRIFQHLSVPDIAKKLLAEWHIEPVLRLGGSYPKLEYRVQYGESDYDFLRRQLVEAGISFYFQQSDKGETELVLSDAPEANPVRGEPLPFVREPASGSGVEGIDIVTGVSLSSEVRSGRATVSDFDFRRPRYALQGTQAVDKLPEGQLEEYHYLPGHSNAESTGTGTPVADRDGAYRNVDKEATARASRRSLALQSAAVKVQFNTSVLDIAPGGVFAMAGHPHPDLAPGKRLLVTQSQLTGDVVAEWHVSGTAVFADKPYRPLLTARPDDIQDRGPDVDPFRPLIRDVKPRVQGVESAIVVGPKGEEIFTDEYGRVRVQFPWDREGAFDEKSSCWLRVSHPAAGAGFGTVNVPRVGQEVLVGFLGGDPDQPIVTGRMFNTTAPLPYPLPEHKTRTSLRTSTSPGGNGANEITFDDKAGGELFYIQAQKDFHKIVKQNELETTQGNRHVSVDGDLILSAKGKVIIQSGDEVVVKGGPNVKINPSETPKAPEKPQELAVAAAVKKPAAPAAANPNKALGGMSPGPMPVSDQTAAVRKKLAEKYQPMAEKLGEKYHLPPALILGLMSRESGFGTLLAANGTGDNGHGFGILQVDNRSHVAVGGPYSEEAADQAVGIFSSGLKSVQAAHPTWTSDQQLAGAVAAYNAGPGNVATQPTNPTTWAQMDQGTTGNNYSRDTWAQSQWFANNLTW
jgi:type VI secretion system secreted protein VgrG